MSSDKDKVVTLDQIQPFGHGWIPNNTGRIYFNLIGIGIGEEDVDSLDMNKENKIKISGLNTSYISDSNYMSSSSGYIGWFGKWLNNNTRKDRIFTDPKTQKEFEISEELASKADVTFSYDKSNLKIYGDITFKLFETKEENEKIIQYSKSSFIIENNGSITFSKVIVSNNTSKYATNFQNEDSKDIEQLVLYQEYIANSMFIIIKNIVHSNSHHHQKIDTATHLTFGEEFNAVSVLESLISSIKRWESDLKHLPSCLLQLKKELTTNDVKGFICYINIFRQVFKDKITEGIKQPKYTHLNDDSSVENNLLASIEANRDRRKAKQIHKQSLLTTTFTFIGILISFNILSNNFTPLSTDWPLFFISFFTIILFYNRAITCAVKSHLFTKHYEVAEIIENIKEANLTKKGTKALIIQNVIIAFDKVITFLFVTLLLISIYFYI